MTKEDYEVSDNSETWNEIARQVRLELQPVSVIFRGTPTLEHKMYFDKDLAQYTIGAVVVWNTRQVGHVKGFSLNSTDEVIVNVLFAGDKEPTSIHPANLELLSNFIGS